VTTDGPVVKVDAADLGVRSASTLQAQPSDDVVTWTVVWSAALVLGMAVGVALRRRRAARTNRTAP
jgi:hypothetical protein